jgi:hypothetical protein
MPARSKSGGMADPDDGRLGCVSNPGGDLVRARPRVEPLASRLERAQRIEWCTYETRRMLDEVDQASLGWRFVDNVWVKGTCVPFFAFGRDAGFFLIWSFDGRWSPRQAALVAPARERIQSELGEDFPGHVEVMFHSPRENTGWHRHLLVDEPSGQPVDVVAVGGRIDEVLESWSPVAGVGLDPVWIDRLCQAGQPRWWRSGEGMRRPPAPPLHEQL